MDIRPHLTPPVHDQRVMVDVDRGTVIVWTPELTHVFRLPGQMIHAT